MNSSDPVFETLFTTSHSILLASVVLGALVAYIFLPLQQWMDPKPKVAAPPSSRVTTESALVVASTCKPPFKQNYVIPFLVLHDVEWSDIGRALEHHDEKVAILLNGQSRALEVAKQSEWDLCINGMEPDFLLSKRIQHRIDRMAVLLEENTRLLQRDLLLPFSVVKVLPNVYSTNGNEIKNVPLRNDPPHRANLEPSESSSYDSASQVILHIARDWTRIGVLVRQSLYDWCRHQISSHMISGGSILVPGAGLGRLAFDLACIGYSVQANELSVLMASAAHAILQRKIQGVIHPFLMDYFINEVNSEWRFEAVPFPDANLLEMSGSLSYTIGDFVETYSVPQKLQDGIVTCFFLDTATNIYEYLYIIYNVLRVGGVWVNVGPLQWHRNALIHVSADELRGLVESFGFEIVHWSIDMEPVDYRYQDPTTTRWTKYEAFKPLRMVAIKRETTKGLRLPRFLQTRHKSMTKPNSVTSNRSSSQVVIEELKE
jgi:SAM-dependent methyltransferase